MATQYEEFVTSNSLDSKYLNDKGFFVRFGVAMVAVIFVGFFQWEARGMADVRNVPFWVHLHGGFMVAWLALFVTQIVLAHRDAMDLHRRLGWLSMAVIAGVFVTGIYTGYRAVELHRYPPFFEPAYFLALTIVEPAMFALLVAAGVALRRRTDWHRRLMMGATIVILEPAFGRLLPMPLLGGWGEWLIMAIQLCFVGAMASHDLKWRGEVHPATLALVAAVIATHCLMALLAVFPPFVAFAGAVAGA